MSRTNHPRTHKLKSRPAGPAAPFDIVAFAHQVVGMPVAAPKPAGAPSSGPETPTTLPWSPGKASEHRNFEGADVPDGRLVIWGADGMEVCLMRDRGGDAFDHADYLLRAANAHVGLVSALRTLVQSLEWEKRRTGTTYNGFEDARAALRAAGEV